MRKSFLFCVYPHGIVGSCMYVCMYVCTMYGKVSLTYSSLTCAPPNPVAALGNRNPSIHCCHYSVRNCEQPPFTPTPLTALAFSKECQLRVVCNPTVLKSFPGGRVTNYTSHGRNALGWTVPGWVVRH